MRCTYKKGRGIADAAVEKMREMFATLFHQTSEEIDINIMLGFAAVYFGGNKKKLETAFYQKSHQTSLEKK